MGASLLDGRTGGGRSCVRASRARVAGGLAVSVLLSSCALLRPPPPAPPPEHIDVSVYKRVADERAEVLEKENERLRADLRAAEETLLAVESGMKGTQRGAEAVSMLAEARLQVDRAAKRAPWRASTAAEAREKLDEASRQLADGHIGSAIFFVSRAARIAGTIGAEADLVAKEQGVRFVKGSRVNLRGAPSKDAAVRAVLSGGMPVFLEHTAGDWLLVRTIAGEVGWMHASLLREKGAGAPVPASPR